MTAVLAVICVLAGGFAIGRERLLVNVSPSAPIGIYVMTDPTDAEFVTFCLPKLPASIMHDPALCSPRNPEGIHVIKRIAEVIDRSMVVMGDGPSPLDSRVFGPLLVDDVRGYWRSLASVSLW